MVIVAEYLPIFFYRKLFEIIKVDELKILEGNAAFDYTFSLMSCLINSSNSLSLFSSSGNRRFTAWLRSAAV